MMRLYFRAILQFGKAFLFCSFIISFNQESEEKYPYIYQVPLPQEHRTISGEFISHWHKMLTYSWCAFKQALSGNFALFRISFTPNFHCVKKDSVYRSSQPAKEQIDGYVKNLGIKVILNLRDELQIKDREKELWKELCNQAKCLNESGYSVRLINMPLNNTEIINPELLKHLLDFFNSLLLNKQFPILIHCESGSGRTGLACALYLIEVEHSDLNQALEQLSEDTYFHIEQLYSNVKYFVRLWFDLRRKLGLNQQQALEEYKKIYSTFSAVS